METFETANSYINTKTSTEGENLKCINTNKVLQSNTAPKYLSKKNTLIFDDKFALHSLWYHHTYRCDDTRGCVMQFWPPGDEHMCSKHVEAWNKTYCETNFVHQVG